MFYALLVRAHLQVIVVSARPRVSVCLPRGSVLCPRGSSGLGDSGPAGRPGAAGAHRAGVRRPGLLPPRRGPGCQAPPDVVRGFASSAALLSRGNANMKDENRFHFLHGRVTTVSVWPRLQVLRRGQSQDEPNEGPGRGVREGVLGEIRDLRGEDLRGRHEHPLRGRAFFFGEGAAIPDLEVKGHETPRNLEKNEFCFFEGKSARYNARLLLWDCRLYVFSFSCREVQTRLGRRFRNWGC